MVDMVDVVDMVDMIDLVKTVMLACGEKGVSIFRGPLKVNAGQKF